MKTVKISLNSGRNSSLFFAKQRLPSLVFWLINVNPNSFAILSAKFIFKYKNKKDYRKKQGHRQPYTKITVEAINA